MFSESKVTEIYCMADDFFVTGKIKITIISASLI